MQLELMWWGREEKNEALVFHVHPCFLGANHLAGKSAWLPFVCQQSAWSQLCVYVGEDHTRSFVKCESKFWICESVLIEKFQLNEFTKQFVQHTHQVSQVIDVYAHLYLFVQHQVSRVIDDNLGPLLKKLRLWICFTDKKVLLSIQVSWETTRKLSV